MVLILKEKSTQSKEALRSAINKSIRDEDYLRYVLAFLNSDLFESLLERKRRRNVAVIPSLTKDAEQVCHTENLFPSIKTHNDGPCVQGIDQHSSSHLFSQKEKTAKLTEY